MVHANTSAQDAQHLPAAPHPTPPVPSLDFEYTAYAVLRETTKKQRDSQLKRGRGAKGKSGPRVQV